MTDTTDIKAIIFDVDGVLIKPPHYFSVQYKKDFGLTINDQEFFTGDFRKTSVGEADLKEIIQPWLKQWGWEKSVDEFLQYWFDFEGQFIDQSMLDLAEKIEAAETMICLGTEQEHHRFDHLMNTLNLSRHFKHPFYTAALGVRKHKPEFFEKILAAIDVPAESTLLIDDSQNIIDSADSIGINTHLFVDQKTLEDFLKSNNVSW